MQKKRLMAPRSHELLQFHPQWEKSGRGGDRITAMHVYHAGQKRWFRMSTEEGRILQLLDGKLELDEVREKLGARGQSLGPDFLNSFIEQAERMGLLAGAPSDPPRRRFAPEQLLFFKFPLLDPSPWLAGPAKLWAKLYQRAALPLWVLIFASALTYLVADSERLFQTGWDHLGPSGIPWLMLGIALVKAGHEVAHAAAAHRHGAEVREMGIAFMLFVPCLYTETSEAWALPRRAQRLEIGVAGVLFEILIGALAAHVWYFTAPGFWNSLAFSLLAVSWIQSLLLNANPLMRFDGYFVLSEWKGIPNLAQKGRHRLSWLFWNRLLGLRSVPDPARSGSEGRFLTIYGILAGAWRFFLAVIIAQFIFGLFFPPLGLLLMLVVLWRFLARPGLLLFQKLWQLRDQLSPRRVPVTLGLIVLLTIPTLLFFPFPWPRVHPCRVEASKTLPIYAPADGQLASWTAEEGMHLEKGQLLGRMDPARLRHRQDMARLDTQDARTRWELIQGREGRRKSLPGLEAALQQTLDQRSYLEEEGRRLEIRSPLSGQVVAIEKGLDPHRLVKRGEMLASLASDGKVRVIAVVPEEALSNLRAGQSVQVWLPIAGGIRKGGRIEDVDRQALTRLEHPALAKRFDGDIATRRDAQGDERPLRPWFRVRIRLDEDSADLPLGLRGRLVVPGPFRPLLASMIRQSLRRLRGAWF
jgi:putative peptide zinc metalloprotease protein